MSTKTTEQAAINERLLPPGWRWVKLKEIGPLTDGDWILNSDYSTSGVRLVQVGDVGERKFIGKSARYITLERARELGVTFLQPGDVLISRMPDPLGRACLLPKLNYPSITAVDVSIWRPNDELADREFVTFYLNSEEWFSTVLKQASGATRPRISRSNLENLALPLPPLAEQQRIAAILKEQIAAVERARRAAEEQLEAAKALPAAYLRQAFPRQGEPLPEGWRWVKLGEVCEKQIGFHDPRQEFDKPFRYVDITSVDNKTKRITEAKLLLGKDAPSRARQVFRTNDVIVSTTRPNLNAVALVPLDLDNQICSTGFCVLRATAALHSNYLFAWVQTKEFVDNLSELVKGALYPAVTKKQVLEQLIPLPPLAEQKRIAAILREQMDAVERARKALEEQLETINKLPAALLRRAFNGEL